MWGCVRAIAEAQEEDAGAGGPYSGPERAFGGSEFRSAASGSSRDGNSGGDVGGAGASGW